VLFVPLQDMKLLLWIPLVLGAYLFSGCTESGSTSTVFDPVKQAAEDELTLQTWFTEKGLKDSVIKTSSGLYYRITKSVPDSILAGPDSMVVNPAKKRISLGKKVFVRYEGRLLTDSLFDSNLNAATAFSFFPGNGVTIKAWEEGLLKFSNLEEGYLYCPSGLAYGNVRQTKIPANSCLKFFIRVTGVE
jgi:FKBP-type peptidyl-prolyl cis-trans isomerase